MNGLVVVNKPYGPTSHQVVQEIRRLIPKVKVGHAGTLDPAATGVLPVCLGKATRIVEYLMDLPKGYRAELELGATTETGDAQGKVIEQFPVPPLTRKQVEQVFKSLTGEQQQVPPRYSAVKYRGKPMYYWARKGIEVKPKPRKIHIYRLELVQFNYPDLPHLILEAECSRGTYIRTLAEQIGERLCSGAFLSALQRTFVGPFTLKQAVSLTEIQDWAGADQSTLRTNIIPIDKALAHFPGLTLTAVNIQHLQQGRTVSLQQCPEGMVASWKPGQLFRIYESGGVFKSLSVLEGSGNELQLYPQINF
ncbi:MAG TPA: tRNA pseudouridine(55) synthase TruB [Firmicutes bacterium]|nr:tRNA pseudouridine(55) synthase TruB [Bacillota bacterium]